MNKEEIQNRIKELRAQGETIYSISRLNTVDSCGWEYWQTYMEHLEPKDNIYSFAGGKIHKCLEDIQNGIEINFPEKVKNILDEAKLLDIVFPSETIEEKWVKDMTCFARDYIKPEYNKVETEKLFLINLNGKYLQGIIDLLVYNEDGTVSIIDYKTSSKFSNADLLEKGRQLILYGLAMEQLGYEVKDLAWNMLKYVEISYQLKNGKIRTTVAERGFVLDKLKVDITKELKALKEYDELTIETMVDTAVENNSFDNLPQSIRDKYTIKDYMVYYDFSEENKIETQKFIQAKIEDIELFKNKQYWWEPKEINAGTKFYCENLCNHRDRCEYLQEYHDIQEQYQEFRDNEEVEKELSKFI